MKKLLKEFKDFAMKGNVLDLAVAVVLGAAFNKVVTAVVEIFLNPIIESLPKIEEGGSAWTAPLISFAAVVVEFLLTAQEVEGAVGEFLCLWSESCKQRQQ